MTIDDPRNGKYSNSIYEEKVLVLCLLGNGYYLHEVVIDAKRFKYSNWLRFTLGDKTDY
jgi:hypothetical protein